MTLPREIWQLDYKTGIENAKLEGKLETAKQLKKMALSENQIVEATGLSNNEIKNLQ